MKIKAIFISMLAMTTLASCSNEDESIDLVPNANWDAAYLSLSIQMPQGETTRADSGPNTNNGTAAESKLSSIYVVGLKDEVIKGVYNITATAGTPSEAFKVAADINKIFVVANPSAKALAQIKAASTYAAMNLAIKDHVNSVSGIAPTSLFMMTSAGTLAGPNDKGLVSVLPQKAATETTADIKAAQNAAKTSPSTVFIDRVVAKVKVNKSNMKMENGIAIIDQWKLNTTNKSFFPYSELIDYNLGGTTPQTQTRYRKDMNWTAVHKDDLANTFNWLKNPDVIDGEPGINAPWSSVQNAEYCYDNTMEAVAQDYNNTTKLVFKAQFIPTGISPYESWFRVGGVIMKFDQIKGLYATASEKDKLGYVSFLDKILGTSRTAGWEGEGKATIVTLEDLDAVSNGGYFAATASPYLIEYYQKSRCYYEVLLKHDNRVQPKLLGRWGVVRNNSYTVNITKVSKPGLPYIPDPTDPAITDPQNPNPTNPTPNDESSAFISVTITVNPWTSWSQDNEL